MTNIVRFRDNKCWFCYISFSRRMKIVFFNSFFDCLYIAIHTFLGFSCNLNKYILCNNTFFALFWNPQDDLVILFTDVIPEGMNSSTPYAISCLFPNMFFGQSDSICRGNLCFK